MTATTSQVKKVKVSDLNPYKNNARTHDDSQISEIAASITEFGFTNPVLIDEENGIIAGHGRVLAAQSLGMDKVPAIKLSGLSEAQKRAYILTDNKLALNAGWDDELLRVEIAALQELDFDLSLTGFDSIEIDDLFNGELDKRPIGQHYEECFNLIITCSSEENQQDTYEKLSK